MSTLGKGAFGQVFLVCDLENHRCPVAMKVENPNSKKQVLKLEISVLRKLQGK